MPDEEAWVQRKEQSAMNEISGGGINVEPGHMLEIGPVNRTIIDENQAYSLILARLGAVRMRRINPKYEELMLYPEYTETHQQTMAGIYNSREQYIRLGSAAIQAVGSFLKKEWENMTG